MKTKMVKKGLGALGILMLMACPKALENKGDKYIASIYQAEVTGGIGRHMDGATVYEISVRNSPIVDSLTPKFTASNIALLAFEGLSDADREKAEGIVVNLRTTKGQTATYSYNKQIMEMAAQKAVLYRKMSDLLLAKDFATVLEHRDTSKAYPSYNGQWPEKMGQLEQQYGKLKGYAPYGLREIKDSRSHEFQFFGYLQFEKRNYPYKFDFEIANTKEQWSNFLLKENLR